MKRSLRPGIIALFFFLSLARADSVAHPKFPRTSPCKLMAEWMSLFNEGNPQKLAPFIKAHYGERVLRGRAPEQIADGQMHIRQGAGAIQLAAIEKSSPSELVAIFKSEGAIPQYFRLAWRFEEAPSDRLKESFLTPAEAPNEANTAPKRSFPEVTRIWRSASMS